MASLIIYYPISNAHSTNNCLLLEYNCKIIPVGSYFWKSHFCYYFTAPDQAPRNVTASNTSSTSLLITWRPVDNFHINGILQGYRVLYFETESLNPDIKNITIYIPSRKKRAAEDEPLTLPLTELKKFTLYTIRVLAFTILDGVFAEMNLTTAQDGKYIRFNR